MITPCRLPRLLVIAILAVFFANLTTAAAQNTQRDRIQVRQARMLTPRSSSQSNKPTARPKSRVAQAALGELGHGTSNVAQVSYGCDSGCGPVCDCGGEASCGFEPGCGIEGGCGVAGCTSCGGGLHGLLSGDPACGAEFLSDCGCDSCRTACDVERFPLLLPIFRVQWNRFEFFSGTHGFTNQLNYAENNAANSTLRSGSGSFGFHQGFNEGRSLKRLFGLDLASQFGLRATQNNLSGTEFTSESRYQIFLTAGLFRRVDYGLQYGIAFDYLNEDWYYEADVTQLRGELSWKTGTCHAFGFRFASALDDSTSTASLDDGTGTGTLLTTSVTTGSVDQYRLFYRRLLNDHGSWSGFIGSTDDDQTVLGAAMDLPIRQNFSIRTGWTYMYEGDNLAANENETEVWNVSIGFVFRPGGHKGCGRYCRPLFDVADNGSFGLIRR